MKKFTVSLMILLLMAGMAWADEVKDADQIKPGETGVPPVFVSTHGNGGMLLGGGPDEFGYVWRDSNDPDGPVFGWIDISGIGTPATWNGGVDDGYTNLIDMGMAFNFYGIDYSSICISTNGWASFLSQTNSYLNNVTIPTASNPNALLAPLWDDLDGGTVGACYYYYDAVQNQFIISWVNWPDYPDPADPKNFQIILDADDNSIVYQYGAGTFNDTDITVGIENETGTVGLLVAYNQSYATNDLATRFYIPEGQPHDISMIGILSPGSVTLMGLTFEVSSRIRNFGANAETNIPVHFEIRDINGTLVYNQTQTVAALAPGEIVNVVFPDWTPAETDTHHIISYVALDSDMDRTNDSASAATYTWPHNCCGGPVADWSFADNGGGGQPFNWIDISAIGTPITFGSLDDGNSGAIDMGMSFEYFGNTYTQIGVCTNGWVSFSDFTTTTYINGPIPDAGGPTDMIAVLWDDLNVRDGAVYYYYDAAENQFIVQWNNIEFISPSGSLIDMEVILDGGDNTIKMQYNTFAQGCQTDVTVGIENFDETIGLAYNNNGEIGQTPVDGMAITWTYLLQQHDIAASGFAGFSSSGMVGVPITPQAQFINRGLNAETNVPVRLLITPGAYNNSQTIPLINAGDNATVTFADFTPTTGGLYTLTAIAELAGDGAPGNDTLFTTYAAIDNIIDFEASSGNLTGDNDWAWGTPTSGPGAAYSGVNCWATNLDGNYNSSTLSILSFNLNIGATAPAISIASWYDTEARYDGGNFAVSTDFGATWNVISPTRGYDNESYSANPLYPDSIFTGRTQGFWEIVTFPLTGYEGQAVLARFAFGSDGSVQYPGWYIDDLGLIGCVMATAEIDYTPASIYGAAPVGGSDSDVITINNLGDALLVVDASAHINQQAPARSIQPNLNPREDSYIGGKISEDSKKTADQDMILDIVCPTEGTVFGQDPTLPTDDWTFGTTDVEPGYLRFENLAGIFGEITELHFWGIDAVYSGGWAECDENPASIQVTFYRDNAGMPGEVISIYDLSISPVLTSQDFDTFNQKEYVAALSPAMTVAEGWMSIQGASADGCWFLWQNSFAGDQTSLSFDGTDYTVEAYDLAYCLVGQIQYPWLTIDANHLEIAPGGSANINVGMNAVDLTQGTYTGAIRMRSNDPDESNVEIPVTFDVTGGGGPGCHYTPGDVNNNGTFNGIDVSYMVGFFKGGPVPPYSCECTAGNTWYVAGDVNGNCVFNGIDVTYAVRYFKGGPGPIPCSDCPPVPAVAKTINIGNAE